MEGSAVLNEYKFSNARQVYSRYEFAVVVIVNLMCSPVAEFACLCFAGMMKYVINCCSALCLTR